MTPVFLKIDRSQPFSNPLQMSTPQRVTLAVTPEGVLTLIPPQISLPSYTDVIKPKGNFSVTLDVHHFGPEEISVKTIDGFLIIEASHDERRDENCWVKRQFSRRYLLPEGCNLDSLVSSLSSDGILNVTADCDGQSNERVVPIVQTGPVRNQVEARPQMGGDGEVSELAHPLQ